MRAFLSKHSPLVILAVLCSILAILSPEFRTTGNITSVAYRTAVVGIMAVGQTLVILTAGIDLSVGSVAGLGGMVACVLMGESIGLPIPLGILAGAAIGTFCGALNGVVITKGRVPPFIVTLGMMMIARGVTLLISGGRTISGPGGYFAYLGGAKGWATPVIITLTLTIVFTIILGFTRFGRSLYAVGGNLAAARLSGIRTDWVRIKAYALSGMCAGFAGVMLASRTSVASPTAGTGNELDAIAACVIGGSSLMGGEGGAIGSLAGALIMNVLVNFCNLKKLEPYWQMVLVGVLIIAMVYYDSRRKQKKGLM